MKRVLRRFGAFAVLLAALGAPNLAAQEQAARPPVTIHAVEAAGVKVAFLDIPWGPETFAAMEQGGDSFYNRRTWPFARLESRVAFTLDGTRILPGNYALVFHPSDAARTGMSLEVLKIDVPEFLVPGNVMTRTPAGQSVHKAPVAFEKVADVVPALDVALEEGDGSVALRIRYGNRRLAKELKL